MLHLFTATHDRHDVLKVFRLSLRKCLLDTHRLAIASQDVTLPEMDGADAIQLTQNMGLIVPVHIMANYFHTDATNLYLEEDFIALAPWSIDSMPGPITLLHANAGGLWPSIWLKRQPHGQRSMIVQRGVPTVNDCPEWLPPQLCEAVVAARSLIAGPFLHLDKMSRSIDADLMARKNRLLAMVAEYLESLPDAITRDALVEPFVPPPPQRPRTKGPGAFLSEILASLWITEIEGCGCKAFAARMDAWGVDECVRRTGEIVEWMRQAAADRGLPFSAIAAALLVSRAITLARSAAG